MSIKFVDNQSVKLIDILRPAIDNAHDARFAVSFVKRSGLALIRENLENCLARGGRIEFLVSLDFQITEAEAVKTLIEMANSGASIKCYSYRHTSPAESATYHPKLYILSGQSTVNLIVGSSNLTSGGLRTNAEANIMIEAPMADEVTSDAYALYNRLKFLINRFEPDISYIEQYGEISTRVQRSSRSALRERSTQILVESLQEKEKSLPRLRISPNDLVGWQKIVFEKLPTGVFANNDIYAFEHEFQRYYPLNQNIKAKVRQILQQLETLGLVRHLGPNQWER
jgi:HKD family nuclease